MKKLPEGVIGTGAHNHKLVKRLPWPVCAHCGMVYLKNAVTRERIKRGCYIWADENGRPSIK